MSKSETRRTVITGVGIVSPLGIDREVFWANLLDGRCAAADVRAFDTSQYKVHRGCEVPEFGFERIVGAPVPFPIGRASEFAIAASFLAALDGGFEFGQADPERVGVCVGTTCGEIQILEHRTSALQQQKSDASCDDWMSRHPACQIPANVAHFFGLAGPNLIIPTACAAGNFAISYAADLIKSGRADVMLAGGTDPFSRVAFTGFARLGSIAPDFCRPFDRNRRGILVGEGAGVVLIESLDGALKRGAPLYAEIVGYGFASDAQHMTKPDPEGGGIGRAMEQALRSSGLGAGAIDYICAHGTGTPINDVVETRAIKRLFGNRAYDMPVSSVKSMLGHTMGAASAIETIVCALALKNEVLPPTVHYETPDPECDLDCVPNRARQQKSRFVLNNALAFGGVNSSLALARVE